MFIRSTLAPQILPQMATRAKMVLMKQDHGEKDMTCFSFIFSICSQLSYMNWIASVIHVDAFLYAHFSWLVSLSLVILHLAAGDKRWSQSCDSCNLCSCVSCPTRVLSICWFSWQAGSELQWDHLCGKRLTGERTPPARAAPRQQRSDQRSSRPARPQVHPGTYWFD